MSWADQNHYWLAIIAAVVANGTVLYLVFSCWIYGLVCEAKTRKKCSSAMAEIDYLINDL